MEPERLLGLVSHVAGALAQRADPGEVIRSVLPVVAEVLQAEVATLALQSQDGTLHVLAATGMHLSVVEPWREFDPSAAVPLAASVREDRPLWVSDVAAARATYPALPENPDNASLCALPLHADGRVIGVLGLGWHDRHEFGEPERHALVSVSELVAAACAHWSPPPRARLGFQEHPAPEGVSICSLTQPGGARVAVLQHRVGSPPGSSSVFASLLDSDPHVAATTLDSVSGVLALARRQGVPPALVGQSISVMAVDLDGPITGAHIEVSPASGWIAVAPLDGDILLLSTSQGDGSPTPPHDGRLAGERLVMTTQGGAAVVAVALDPHVAPAEREAVRAALAPLLDEEHDHSSARHLLHEVESALRAAELEPCVRGVLAVAVPPGRPVRRSRTLPAWPVATVLARRFAVAALPPAADDETRHAVELVTNELVSNAVRHADHEVEVSVVAEESGTLIAVTDDDDRTPDVLAPTTGLEHGRGMTLVTALADEVGIELRRRGGKSVWARVRWRGERPAD
ncbi:GAF domain-containing protein [Motilibacter rhizosphaerae]|uniref:GAF domain-containing protein n=1 Tax=Motilibacter rhizosphaerae TaxID=598652 RepID=A0A4Q7NAK6_9ACTN|nr:GAF domain-containing protein [Motilibacter rhizosphaerae]